MLESPLSMPVKGAGRQDTPVSSARNRNGEGKGREEDKEIWTNIGIHCEKEGTSQQFPRSNDKGDTG